MAYCFSQGLKDGARRGDAAAAVLAACRATSTLHLIVVAHDAREKRHALVAFAESEARRGHVAAQLDVTMSGGRGQFRCWAVRVVPAGGAREAAVGGAEFGARGGGAREPAALGRAAPPCYVINDDQQRVHKLLDGLAWLPWRRLEAVGARGGGCARVQKTDRPFFVIGGRGPGAGDIVLSPPTMLELRSRQKPPSVCCPPACVLPAPACQLWRRLALRARRRWRGRCAPGACGEADLRLALRARRTARTRRW